MCMCNNLLLVFIDKSSAIWAWNTNSQPKDIPDIKFPLISGRRKEEAWETNNFVATSSSYRTNDKELYLGIKWTWKVGAPFFASPYKAVCLFVFKLFMWD